MKSSQLLLTAVALAFPTATYAQHGSVRGGAASGAHQQQQMVHQQQQMVRQQQRMQQQMVKEQQQMQQAQQRDATTGQDATARDAATTETGQETAKRRATASKLRQIIGSPTAQRERPKLHTCSKSGIACFEWILQKQSLDHA